MKTRYKILIIVLILITASVFFALVAQSLQYKMTIEKFERNCDFVRERDNRPNVDCMWPGGPPSKPILDIP